MYLTEIQAVLVLLLLAWLDCNDILYICFDQFFIL